MDVAPQALGRGAACAGVRGAKQGQNDCASTTATGVHTAQVDTKAMRDRYELGAPAGAHFDLVLTCTMKGLA